MTMPEAATHIELQNGVQDGPIRTTGQFGTSLDYTYADTMMFYVDVAFVDGGRLCLGWFPSYEDAIVEAEEAARDWGVQVHDQVEPI